MSVDTYYWRAVHRIPQAVTANQSRRGKISPTLGTRLAFLRRRRPPPPVLPPPLTCAESQPALGRRASEIIIIIIC